MQEGHGHPPGPGQGTGRAEGARTCAPVPGHGAQAEHVRVFPQGPLGPPAPRGSRVEPRGGRAERNRAPKAAQAVPGGEALSTKMGDAHAEHAPEGLVDPAVAWGTLGPHVVTARGARGACGGGGVGVHSLARPDLTPSVIRRRP